jgi:hypothetical protein
MTASQPLVTGAIISPGIYYDLSAAEYHAAPGLSHSAMKHLAVSPYRFWHNCVNPEREPIEPTPAMIFGSALHSATLDDEATFDAQFCCEYAPPEGALDTVPQLRDWHLMATGNKAKGTAKEEVAAQVRSISGHPPIVMDEEKRHFVANEGKTILKSYDWQRLTECTQALAREPEFQRLRHGGRNEVSYFVTDPETGVLLKARMDCVTPTHSLDPKTFSSKGKTIDKAVCDAIYYESYNRQAWLYTYIRHLAGEGSPDWVNVFIESEQPHEVRIKRLSRNDATAHENLYWSTARIETQRLMWLYAECKAKFGDKPWRTDASIETLEDQDIPALAWGKL